MKTTSNLLQMNLFEPLSSGNPSLDICTAFPNQMAPLATSHAHIRTPICNALSLNSVQDYLTSFPTPSFAPMLVQSSTASVIDSFQSVRSVWFTLKRLSATALTDLSIRISRKSTGEDVVVWDHHEGCEDLYFVTHVPEHDPVETMLSLANEILETIDAFGRFYLLPSSCAPALSNKQHVVAYLTEGEVDMLDAVGITVA